MREGLIGLVPTGIALAVTFGFLAALRRVGPKWLSSFMASAYCAPWNRQTYFKQVCVGLGLAAVFTIALWTTARLINLPLGILLISLPCGLVGNAFLLPLLNATYPPVIDDWLDWRSEIAEND